MFKMLISLFFLLYALGCVVVCQTHLSDCKITAIFCVVAEIMFKYCENGIGWVISAGNDK